MESGPTQAVLPLVGLAAERVIRDRCKREPGLPGEAGRAKGPVEARSGTSRGGVVPAREGFPSHECSGKIREPRQAQHSRLKTHDSQLKGHGS
ncbi:MAG: hypothetical protein ACQESR_01255 [Planctomycetota bacterium]